MFTIKYSLIVKRNAIQRRIFTISLQCCTELSYIAINKLCDSRVNTA